MVIARIYENVLCEHLDSDRQMLFLSGPRQVGKTTAARQSLAHYQSGLYLNWDNVTHRRLVLAGPQAISEALQLEHLHDERPVCVLDELHRYGRWKDLLKGLFDTYGDLARFIVTGSARLDVYKAGADSLMGRYFSYRMHPLSVAELLHQRVEPTLIRAPQAINDEMFAALQRFGGFPEPFARSEMRFWRKWSRSRRAQLFKDDLRDLTRLRELGQVEVLAELIRESAGQLINYSSLSKQIGVSVDTVRRWFAVLESLFFCFSIQPWHRNIARSLRKNPKCYLWDWSQIENEGMRNETMVAVALNKAVQLWTDLGFGEFGLFFLRDKEKREVDFLVTRDGQAWFLIEVKSSGKVHLSKSLKYFQQQSGAAHAFQLAFDLPYVQSDCFAHTAPIIVPARTFLAQLV